MFEACQRSKACRPSIVDRKTKPVSVPFCVCDQRLTPKVVGLAIQQTLFVNDTRRDCHFTPCPHLNVSDLKGIQWVLFAVCEVDEFGSAHDRAIVRDVDKLRIEESVYSRCVVLKLQIDERC
jgi:hypothetical protein